MTALRDDELSRRVAGYRVMVVDDSVDLRALEKTLQHLLGALA